MMIFNKSTALLSAMMVTERKLKFETIRLYSNEFSNKNKNKILIKKPF